MFRHVARAVRTVRLGRGWAQETLADRAGLSDDTISRIERGGLAGVTLGTLVRVVEALGASVHVQIRWRGELLDRLIDTAHAAIQQDVAHMLTRLGWDVRVEVSFNHYGDRGRVDILARHPTVRILAVIEIKSALGDLQDTLGRLDVKVRLGRQLAHELGWSDAVAVVPVLVIGDSRRARGTVSSHPTLFARFTVRGRRAVAWLRHPASPMPDGLLWFASRPNSDHARVGLRQRAPKRINPERSAS
jgi:transcriptional regulator with XRE-family HTH domain